MFPKNLLFLVFPTLAFCQNPVKIEIFGESLCPDTSRFIFTQLLPFAREIPANSFEFDITYHPFGKQSDCITNKSTGTVSCTCQHGYNECFLNSIQACVIETLLKFSDYIEPVACIQGAEIHPAKCINELVKSDSDKQKIKNCSKSNNAYKLLQNHQEIQKNVAPNVNYVPYILINGERNYEAEHNLGKTVCANFSALGKPEICSKFGI